MIGASFREVPLAAMAEVNRIVSLSDQIGLAGVLAIGTPNQPLLGIPVPQGSVGLVVCGGLNPVAALVESGLPVTSTAMHSLCGFEEFVDYRDLTALLTGKGL